MDKDETRFMTLVENAPLASGEKEELKRLAEAGVDKALWRRLDDMIVASLESRRLALKEYREALDGEIRRITARHEEEARAIDAKMREDLERAADDGERDRLWDGYYSVMHGLQERLLDEMRRAAGSLKQDALRRVSRGGIA